MLKCSKPLCFAQDVCVSFIIPDSFFPLFAPSPLAFPPRQLGSFCTQHPFPFTNPERPSGKADTGNAASKENTSLPCDIELPGRGCIYFNFFKYVWGVFCFFPILFKALFYTFPFLLVLKTTDNKTCKQSFVFPHFPTFPLLSQASHTNAPRGRGRISSCLVCCIHMVPTELHAEGTSTILVWLKSSSQNALDWKGP